MPRFVILRHELPGTLRGGVHWDFMLEHGAMLRTWALSEEPAAGLEIRADVLVDHRPFYLDYEGPISGDRGSVSRWDSGEYDLVTDTPVQVVTQLRGARLTGTAVLRTDSAGPHRWIFEFSVAADG